MAHIGFVGVGRMGANMARRLHDQGHCITAVQDRVLRVAQTLALELGCEAAQTPGRVGEVSQVVVTVVSDDAAMRAIYAEETPSSLLAFAKNRLFINCATITPSVHVEVEEAVERQGGACLEACMASSISQARQGTLYLMCGGKPDALVFGQTGAASRVLETDGRGHADSCPRMLFLSGPCREGFRHSARAGQLRGIDLAFGASRLRTI